MANQTAKKTAIKKKVKELLDASYSDAKKKIEKAINSGAIDIENWNPENNSWLIPKIIAIAILEDEASDLKPSGNNDSLTRKVTKEVKNLKPFI